jgi:ATP-binding cassette subfamily F protein 3
MARLMLEPYNLLVLDEPTNHMDMRSKDILKNALMKYDGTLIVVSHDREFLDGLVDKIYEFRDGKVKEHLGGIWDFMQKLKLESMRELEKQNAAAVPEAVKAAPKKEEKKRVAEKQEATKQESVKSELSYAEKKEQDKQQRKLQKQREDLEKRIESCDAELSKMDADLAEDPTNATADFFEKYNALKKQQEDLMWEWGKLI